MFRVCHEEALVAVKKLDENETNLEAYESPESEERYGIVNVATPFRSDIYGASLEMRIKSAKKKNSQYLEILTSRLVSD